MHAARHISSAGKCDQVTHAWTRHSRGNLSVSVSVWSDGACVSRGCSVSRSCADHACGTANARSMSNAVCQINRGQITHGQITNGQIMEVRSWGVRAWWSDRTWAGHDGQRMVVRTRTSWTCQIVRFTRPTIHATPESMVHASPSHKKLDARLRCVSPGQRC